MPHSVLPFYLVIVFGFSLGIAHRAAALGAISRQEIRQVHILLGPLSVWTLICAAMGIKGLHASPALQAAVPFLWQAMVPVVILAAGLLLSDRLRRALGGIATATPLAWFVWFQALRIGAVGGVVKGLRGEILSSYVFWVGIPDMIYGFSALVLAVLLVLRPPDRRVLLGWHLLGPAIILLPTFGGMSFFMRETGFNFIMAFPMVLAPGIVVPLLIFFNLLAAWKLRPVPGPKPGNGKSRTARARPSPGPGRPDTA